MQCSIQVSSMSSYLSEDRVNHQPSLLFRTQRPWHELFRQPATTHAHTVATRWFNSHTGANPLLYGCPLLYTAALTLALQLWVGSAHRKW